MHIRNIEYSNLSKKPYEVITPFTGSYIAAGGTLTFDATPYPNYSLFMLFSLTGFFVIARFAESVSYTAHNVTGVTAKKDGLKITFSFSDNKNYALIRIQ